MNNFADVSLKCYLGLAFLFVFFISCSATKEKAGQNQLSLKDANISLLGTRQLTFENVDFLVPGNALEVSVASSEEPVFIKSKPQVINLVNK